jgi:pimeloyl-ACP methyl ester carboxylesterase
MRFAFPVLVLIAAAHAPVLAGPSPEPSRLSTTRRVPTEDGGTVALHHHPGPGSPVLLVHGISSNHRFFDLDADHSMADWLVDQGWDVWMLDLRGHGKALFDRAERRQITGWSVDDYGRYDVPAAVDWIQRVTGEEKLAFVGHSMGGMVAAIYLQTHPDAPISSLTVLGSPASFAVDDPVLGLAATGLGLGGALTLYVDSPVFADLSASLGAWSPGRLHERLYNPANLSKTTQLALLRTVVSPMSRKEMAHFAKMIRTRSFSSFDGSIDWGAGMSRIQVPTLAVVGTEDRVVLPDQVRAYHAQVGGERSLFEAVGYGHLDLALGERAEEEVFPQVLAWMEKWR